MLLEVAVNGSAQALVAGDRNMVSLNPFQGVMIVTPSKYIRRKA
jgi:predicted nucleic acid-binding protein